MGNNFSLKIEDFQSIGNAILEFTPGINLILGQSNSGKTAILRAIDSVLSNPSYAKTFVKHRTSGCGVTFEYDGNTVSWQKSAKGGTTYTINGEEYSKVGTSDLFDILSNNGFVKSDSEEVMNIEGEWDLPFPFDRTPAELFRLFENVFCVSDSATILKSFKEEESDLVKQCSDVKDKIKRTNSKISSLEELEQEANLVKLKDDLSTFENNANAYFDLLDDYETVKKSERFENFDISGKLPPEEDTLSKFLETEKELKFLIDVAGKIKSYKSLPDTMDVPNTLKEYEQVKEDYNSLLVAQQANNFNMNREIEITGDTLNTYFNLLEDLKEITLGATSAKLKMDKECTRDRSNTLSDYLELANDVEDIIGCYRKCKDLSIKGKALNDRIAEIEKQLKEYKVCPLCGHELNGEHVGC